MDMRSGALVWLTLLICALHALGNANPQWPDTIKEENCEFDKIYTRKLNKSVEYMFVFNNLTQMALFKYFGAAVFTECGDVHVMSRNPPRVTVHSPEATYKSPLLVVVRQDWDVVSWQLPLLSLTTADTKYDLVSRTLCPRGGNDSSSLSNLDENLQTHRDVFVVGISASSETDITFTLSAEFEHNFFVGLNETRNTSVSASQPRFFAFEFPDEVDLVKLELDSHDDICMTVAVQDSMCPVLDLERNVEFDGHWQTMSRKGAFVIPRSHRFPQDIFFIVIVVRGDDDVCIAGRENFPPGQDSFTSLGREGGSNDPRVKHLNFHLMHHLPRPKYVVAIILLILPFVVFYLVAGIVVCVKNKIEERTAGADYGGGNINDDALLEENKTLEDKVNDGEVVFVSDMVRIPSAILRETSRNYLWSLCTVALFYALPVVQLFFIYQKFLNRTGNEDLCYYNFRCSNPLLGLSDFNHVFSNLGYIMLGSLFMLLTWRRERRHHAAVNRNPTFDEDFGIPQQFGVFYALGAALITEGCLSACYHICPGRINFQFDTSFMYVIAMLSILRLYQNRHPGTQANANITFGIFALVISLGMSGVIWGEPLFWWVVTPMHVLVSILLSAQVYYLGCWSLDLNTCSRILESYDSANFESMWARFKPLYPDKMVLLILVNLINLTLAVVGASFHPRYFFALYVLTVFMINLVLYCSYYAVMKYRSGETLLWTPFLFLVSSILLWGGSMYFFMNKEISWPDTPATSRTFNLPCRVFEFYDSHDIWHCLSAFSLFFSFMFLLTLDDDLKNTPRNRIKVF